MRRRIGLVMAVAAVIAFTGCSSNAGGSGQGGVLRIGTSSGISSLNPFVGFNQDDYATWMYIYPTLVQYDTTTPTYDFAPNFAQSWERSKDGLKLTFHTAPNATWSDGQPLTAEDVVWTFDMIQKYAHGPTGSLGRQRQARSRRSRRPTTTRWSRPTRSRPRRRCPTLGHDADPPAAGVGAVRDRRRQGHPTVSRTSPTDGQPLVGGGPFVLTEYRKNDIALFQRNPNWYGTPPHIDGFGLQFFRDEDAMVTALKTGQLDAINEIPPTSVDTLKSSGMQVYDGPGARDARLHHQLDPEQDRPSRAAQPEGARGDRVRDRPQRDRADRVARATRRPARRSIPEGNATGGTQWHDRSDPAAAVRHRQGQRRSSTTLGYAKGSDGIRVANGHPMYYTVLFA